MYCGRCGAEIKDKTARFCDNCGAPLETGGGAGTADSHWSESIFGAELMTGYAESAPPMPLSRLTIAAMKDLGYGVDFSAAQSFTLSLQAQSLEPIALIGVTEAVRTL